LDTQFVLKRFDLKAQRRLAQVEEPSASTEMKSFSDGQERTDVTEFHAALLIS
jgi:hypothetical protein